MQYANVIVNHKAGYEPLTYAIPAELLAHLAVGSVVLVPLANKQVHGVVSQFIRRLDDELARKLKPIVSIVYPEAQIPQYVLDAAQSLHEKYGYGLGETLFTFLPHFPKRKQKEIAFTPASPLGYKATESLMGVAIRPQAYHMQAQKLAQLNLSLLIICHSVATTEALAAELKQKGLSVVLCPQSHQEKARRDYFFAALNAKPTVFIGTRGALITPLTNVGAIVIDEPWLPGHKEDNTPRFWSALAAQQLCKARGIRLYVYSLYAWPETKLIEGIKTYQQQNYLGQWQLTPRRSLRETLSQFLSEHGADGKQLGVFIRQAQQPTHWCSRCKTITTPGMRYCPKCQSEVIVLPALTKEAVSTELEQHEIHGQVSVYSLDEMEQFTRLDAALVLNFDVFFSIIDFRTMLFRSTLLGIIRSQASITVLATTHPDEWTRLLQQTPEELGTKELATRRKYYLPPYSLAVQLSSKQKDILEKVIAPLLCETQNDVILSNAKDLSRMRVAHNGRDSSAAPQNDRENDDILLKVGKIHVHRDGFTLSLLLKPNAKIPAAWHKKQFLKVDILPNYVD